MTLEEALWNVAKRFFNSYGWLPTLCPVCFKGVLSSKMSSDRLVCLSCNAEFSIVEIKKDGI
jgi:hypothetical protein